MSELVKVMWDGESCTIPGYGEVTNGSEISLPEDMAESFKKQGLLKNPAKHPKILDLKEEAK